MSLSNISIKNPVFAWMLMAGIIVFGMLAFFRLGISQLPDVDAPVISISCSWENAAPQVMETEVTDVIEDSIMGIQGVEEVTSSSRQGSSRVTIQFDINKDIDAALQEVQGCISRLMRTLPKDMDPPVLYKSNPEDQPIIWLTLSGDKPLKYLMEYTENQLKDQFSTVAGVGEVGLGGFVNPSLRVWLDAEKMRKNELTVDDITSAIATGHNETPAGYIDTGSQEMNIRVLGEAETVKEFSSLIIPSRRGSTLWKKFIIGDVAEVEDGLDNIRGLSRTMGTASVGIGIKKQRGTNAVEVSRAVKAKMNRIQKYLPEGLRLETRFDTTTFVENSIKEMYFVMILSVILTSFVCWLFLGSLGSAFNVFLTIPMSICGTLFILYILGFTLNTFTLLGLSLVIGIIVDDAIMMLENISRHREGGETRIKSAMKGSQEITFAAVAATVAILAIFVPVIFMKGLIGKYFLQFGVTISVAVMISLLGALTLTPMFCAQFLTTGHTTRFGKTMDKLINNTRKGYTSALGWCLDNRWKVVMASLVFFIASLFLFGVVKKEFIPAQDQSRLMVRIETTQGASLEYTDAVFRETEKKLMTMPEVESYYCFFGTDDGMIMLNLKSPKQRPVDSKKKRRLSQQELIPAFRKELKDIPGIRRIVVTDPSLMSFGGRRGTPVSFNLIGPDWDTLANLSAKMSDEMDKTGLMTDLDTDYEVGLPEVRILPERQKAAERSVSISDIGNTINALIGGVRAGKYTRGGRRYDIRVQLVSKDRKNVNDINKIWVRNNRGEVIQLSEVVSMSEKPSLLSISRWNRERSIRVSANVATGKSQGEALAAVESIAKKNLPEGYRIVFTGGAQTFKESFSGLYIALILGIFVAYMVLGTQFNSFVHPFTVLIALPFSISGAVIAMLVTGQTFNIYSAIGIILLMGIVKKNSILLVDFTNQRRESGMKLTEALKDACPIRLRPILMTSFATIAAAVPPALAIGPGAETRVPMAIVVIGGVFLSTLLTLFVVPCFYSLMSVFESKQHQKEVHEAMKELEQVK